MLLDADGVGYPATKYEFELCDAKGNRMWDESGTLLTHQHMISMEHRMKETKDEDERWYNQRGKTMMETKDKAVRFEIANPLQCAIKLNRLTESQTQVPLTERGGMNGPYMGTPEKNGVKTVNILMNGCGYTVRYRGLNDSKDTSIVSEWSDPSKAIEMPEFGEMHKPVLSLKSSLPSSETNTSYTLTVSRHEPKEETHVQQEQLFTITASWDQVCLNHMRCPACIEHCALPFLTLPPALRSRIARAAR